MPTVLQRKDIDTLSRKLEQFAEELPEQEKNVLGWILARSQAAADAELSDSALDAVSGGAPLSTRLAEAAGFDSANEGKSTIKTEWTYTF